MAIDKTVSYSVMPGQENSLNYTYSAPQQDELRKIRKKYLPKEETPMEHLRRLDESVDKKGMALSLAAGTIGALILGIGMCCCMVWGGVLYIPGIVIGIAGLAVVCIAHPMYISVTQRERKRIAPEILRLTDELLKEKERDE